MTCEAAWLEAAGESPPLWLVPLLVVGPALTPSCIQTQVEGGPRAPQLFSPSLRSGDLCEILSCGSFCKSCPLQAVPWASKPHLAGERSGLGAGTSAVCSHFRAVFFFLNNPKQKLSCSAIYLPKACKSEAVRHLHFFHISLITSSQTICKSLINFRAPQRGSIRNQSVGSDG